RRRIIGTPSTKSYLASFLPITRRSGELRSKAAVLRRRHQEALAMIALRDINRQATLREVLKSLSDLADATIETTVRMAGRDLPGHGPRPPRGLRLTVVGLGRLGYREMDYASDVDLIFVYEAERATVEARSLARIWGERIVRTLSTLSRDGQ